MKIHMKSTGGQPGFSLVEVIIALFVLLVGLLTIAAAFTNGMRILAATPTQLAAKELAATIIDDLTISKDTGGTLAGSGDAFVERTVCSGTGNICRTFEVKTKITDDAEVVGLSHVEVTVRYMAGGIRRHYVKAINLGR